MLRLYWCARTGNGGKGLFYLEFSGRICCFWWISSDGRKQAENRRVPREKGQQLTVELTKRRVSALHRNRSSLYALHRGTSSTHSYASASTSIRRTIPNTMAHAFSRKGSKVFGRGARPRAYAFERHVSSTFTPTPSSLHVSQLKSRVPTPNPLRSDLYLGLTCQHEAQTAPARLYLHVRSEHQCVFHRAA